MRVSLPFCIGTTAFESDINVVSISPCEGSLTRGPGSWPGLGGSGPGSWPGLGGSGPGSWPGLGGSGPSWPGLGGSGPGSWPGLGGSGPSWPGLGGSGPGSWPGLGGSALGSRPGLGGSEPSWPGLGGLGGGGESVGGRGRASFFPSPGGPAGWLPCCSAIASRRKNCCDACRSQIRSFSCARIHCTYTQQKINLQQYILHA